MVAAQVILTPVKPASNNSTVNSNEWSDRPLNDVICLFDVDGTLSLSRKVSIVVLIYQSINQSINMYL